MPEAPKMDESEVRRAAGDVIDLYTRHADAWDAARGAEVRIEGTWLSRLADGLPPGGRVLDLGCGPSICNILAASRWTDHIYLADLLQGNR